MKKTILLVFAVMCANVVFGQTQPNWIDQAGRERNYPNNTFFTGFTPGIVMADETQNEAIARLRKAAQGYVAEAISVQLNSVAKYEVASHKTENDEKFNAIFKKTIETAATIELPEMTTEHYVDGNLIYAFAYVNKYEMKGTYNTLFKMNLQQLESVLNTAKQLEASGDKSKARTQYEEAGTLLVKIEQEQNVLAILDKNIALQREKTALWRSDIVLALARLAQGIYICMESKEDMFGKSSSLITNKIKNILSKNGCSFTTDASQADFILKLNASARKHGNPGDIVFCYADVEIELIKKQSGKTIYQEELKQKGGHTTYENAAREAFEEVGQTIAGKIVGVIKN